MLFSCCIKMAANYIVVVFLYMLQTVYALVSSSKTRNPTLIERTHISLGNATHSFTNPASQSCSEALCNKDIGRAKIRVCTPTNDFKNAPTASHLRLMFHSLRGSVLNNIVSFKHKDVSTHLR